MSLSSFCSPVALCHTDATAVASAKDISLDSILQFNRTLQFYIASQSRPGAFHLVDLNLSTCDCQDFPRTQFCKHMAAVHLHFPHLCSKESNPMMPPDYSLVPDQLEGNSNPESAPAPKETLLSLVREITMLCQKLVSMKIDQSHSNYPAIIEAMTSAKYALMAAIAARKGTNSALPPDDKEPTIAPNQKSWGATPAARTDVKRAPKRKCLPEERGLTERAIGVVVAKGPRPKGSKRRRRNSDAYWRGPSGKYAEPDALSPEANRLARARASASSSATVPASSESTVAA